MDGRQTPGTSFAIALSDEQWELVADLFDPPGRRTAPAVIPRRLMVDAMLFITRTGCQWARSARALRSLDGGLGPVVGIIRRVPVSVATRTVVRGV